MVETDINIAEEDGCAFHCPYCKKGLDYTSNTSDNCLEHCPACGRMMIVRSQVHHTVEKVLHMYKI